MPSAWTSPRTNVVLPAPSVPIRQIFSSPRSVRANSAAKARVSDSLWEMKSEVITFDVSVGGFVHGAVPECWNIHRVERLVGILLLEEVAAQSVRVHCRDGGLQRRYALRKKRRDGAGQHTPVPAEASAAAVGFKNACPAGVAITVR